MKSTYELWLRRQGYSDNTIPSRLTNARRVEQHYGDLDDQFDRDQLRGVIEELKYSSEDERRAKPNPSKIPFVGNTRNNLSTYRSATELYSKFRRDTMLEESDLDLQSPAPSPDREEIHERSRDSIALERDLQMALRRNIDQLEPGLEITDDGAERFVASGFIDITARDMQGALVVIELKTATARRDAVGQILSYMGDVSVEEPGAQVRGILVASDFDKKSRAAARMVPFLSLRAYRVNFEFIDVDEAD